MNIKLFSKEKTIWALAYLSLLAPTSPYASAYIGDSKSIHMDAFEKELSNLFPQRISISDSSYHDCQDLKSANIGRDSMVIMAVENSDQNQNAEFWVVKPESQSNSKGSNNIGSLKKLSVTCHFKKPLSDKTDRLSRLMIKAITPKFGRESDRNIEKMLNPYKAKDFNQQIEDYVRKEKIKKTPTSEPEGVLNTILGAIGLEIFGGGAWATATGDGTWRQEKYYPYEIHSISPSYGAGISVKPTSKDEFRIGYQHLMSFGIDAIAIASDYNVEPCHTPGSGVECWPVSHWHSEGGVNQVYMTYGRKFFVFGFPVIAEAGINANQATYTVTVPDYNGGGPADGPPSEPHFLQVKTPVKTRWSGSLGIGTQPLPKDLPGLTLMASAEFPVGATHVDYPTGYYGFVVTLNARYRFCLLENGNCKR